MIADLIVKGFSDFPTNCNDCRFCDRTMQQADEITGQEYIGECNIGEFLLDKVQYPNDGICPLYRTVPMVGTLSWSSCDWGRASVQDKVMAMRDKGFRVWRDIHSGEYKTEVGTVSDILAIGKAFGEPVILKETPEGISVEIYDSYRE